MDGESSYLSEVDYDYLDGKEPDSISGTVEMFPSQSFNIKF